MTASGSPDWPWIIVLIALSLTVIAAYVRIYLFWCKSYFAEEPRDRNPRLMDLAQIFLWCAVCGYATSVLMYFWPAYRLVAVCLLFLAFWSWRFSWNIAGFRVAFTAGRYQRMVERDSLTDLLSRSAILATISRCLSVDENQENTRTPLAVLFLDFDRFKIVNDSMGHDAGDALLKQIAHRLTDAVRFQAFDDSIKYHIGRLGGDEFVVVMEGCDDRDRIDALATRLQQALTHSYSIHDRQVNSSASIGITCTSLDYTNTDEMLRDADTAMYVAKKSGRARTAWFDRAMHEQVKETLELEHDLKRAIDEQQFFLMYQPIIDLEDASITGFEALIRWRHPVRGLIGPDRFIPLAEDSLLIRPIGRWVIETAARQSKIWRDRFPELADHIMNVNISSLQFQDHELADCVADTLDACGLPREAMCLEVTESAVMQDVEQAIESLHNLRSLGITLAMDDFGTGYSSLSHLHQFPIDVLKIDKSFIFNLDTNRDYAAVIHAVSTLADNLGMSVVAEGIETADQLVQLQALSCHKGQGYLFHKPADPAVIEAYLSDREQKSREGSKTA